MRNLIQLSSIMLSLTLLGCQATTETTSGPTVTNEGASIDIVKTMIENYNKGDFAANLSYYADTAKFYPQGWGINAITPQQLADGQTASLEPFSEYKLEGMVFEAVNIEGVDWVHVWGSWTGKLKADGSEVVVPVFLNPAIENGKISMFSRYMDASIVQNAIEKAAAAEAESAEE